MRRAPFLLAAALILLATIASAQATEMERLPTPYSYKKLVERLDAAVKASEMGLVTRASATVGVKAVLGEDIPGNMVVGVYRPDFAKRMLAANVEAGIEAPIRFYITENPDGTATLSYRKPSTVFAPYADPSGDLAALAAELDAIFAKIAKDATAS